MTLSNHFKVMSKIICLQVNVKPYNSQSLYFHGKYGFKEIGQKDTENGIKRVSYLIYKMNKLALSKM